MSCFGCNRLDTETGVTLELSGKLVCSSCPEWRAECAARHLLEKLPNREARNQVLDNVAKKAGEAASQKLKNDVLALWHHRQRVKR